MTRDVRSPARLGCTAIAIVTIIFSLCVGVSTGEAQTLKWGDLVVSDSGLLHVDPVSGAQTPIVVPPGCCGGITFDGNGDILAIAGGPARVLKIDVPSLAVSTVSTGQLLVSPNSITVASNGDILLTDHGALRVIRIDPTTGVQTLVSSGGFFSMPSGIVVDTTGQIFVADANAFGGGGGVIRIDSATGAQVVVSSGGNFAVNPSNGQSSDPTGIALAANGDLLVADPRGIARQGGLPGQVVRVDPTTGVQTVVSASGLLADPWGIAVARNSLIFVSDPADFSSAARIVRLDPVTASQTVVSAGVHLVGPLAIAIVPALVSAGADQVLTANNVGQATTQLAGTSNSPPGSADTYCWTWDTSAVPPPPGNCAASVPSVSVTLGLGIHTFRFWVTEPNGESAFDDVQVTVQLPEMIGPRGEKGDKGDKGDQGIAGPQGIQGEKGDKGDQGTAGPQGAQGEKGDKGDRGDAGAPGAPGAKGDKGDQGAVGPQGAKGDAGAPGALGPAGPEGPVGPQGPKGEPAAFPKGTVIELVAGAVPPPGFTLVGSYIRELRPPDSGRGSRGRDNDSREVRLRVNVFVKQ